MEEMKKQKTEAVEVDLRKLFRALWSKAWLLALVSVICAALTLVFTVAFIAPKYEASATFYVNNGSLITGDKGGMSSSDIAASRGLVSTYIEILTTRETLQKVIDYAGLDMTPAQLKGMITAEAVEETELFQVSCTHTDPAMAEKIAKAITKVFPSRITSIITNTTVQVVDSPVLPTAPVSPNKVTNTILGFLVGFLLSAGVVALQDVLDVTIRSEEDIAQACPIWTLRPSLLIIRKVPVSGLWWHRRRALAPTSALRPRKPISCCGPSCSIPLQMRKIAM